MKKFVGFYYSCSFKVCLWVFLSLIGLMFLSSSAFALQSGDFYYTVSGGTVTITGFTSCQSELTPTAVIPDTIDSMPVVGIGNDAFEYCSGLTSVIIPDSVTSIGNEAFRGCHGLTSVTIPDSVTSIGRTAFAYCSGLTSIVVDASNTAYSSQDGVLYNKTMTMLIQYPGGKSGGFIIPDSVTTLGIYAFSGSSGLTSVTIGNSVTSIGTDAFSACRGLTSVTIGNSVTYIGFRVFQYCSGLTSVTIGNSVTWIGDDAFYYCTGLTSVTIPDSVTNIWQSAFYGCSGLTSVTIGNSVTYIGDGAFAACTGLTSVTIPNSVTSIRSYAFSGCSGLTKAYFLGNAPSMGVGVFRGYASDFSICYTAGSTGFTTPTWNGYPAAVCVPPTVINLSFFTAIPKSEKVILAWSTEAEIDNAGFNLYRSESENGEYTKINASLIQAKGSSIQGASYEFVDTNVKNRKSYYYKLEDIDLNGTSTMHGPVSATPRWILGIFGIFGK